MIVLRLEHWPDGDQTRSEDLGQATLTLIGPGADELSSYELAVSDRGVPVYKGWVDGRKKHGSWDLVRLAFSAISSRIRQADEISKE